MGYEMDMLETPQAKNKKNGRAILTLLSILGLAPVAQRVPHLSSD